LQVINKAGAPRVRLVGENRNEIIATELALREARELGLDLILISETGDHPVVKIGDFKKILYEQKKAKVKHKTSEVKEIQLKVNISDHDLETKLHAVKKFLERGDKVKISVRLKGREKEHPQRAAALIDRIVAATGTKKTSAGFGSVILENP